MTLFLNCFDSVLGTIGIPANILLIVAITFSKDSHLKAYSLILFSSALADLIEVVVELMAMTRMMAEFPYLVYIFEGYCTLIGATACQISMQIELHFMFLSILLIAVSFWYRNMALSGSIPSFVHTQGMILASIFSWTNDSADILPHFYPGINLTHIVHASVNFYNNSNKFVAVFCFSAPTIGYCFIFYYRQQVNRKMFEQMKTMSNRTKQMHGSLIRALSYHAILPSVTMIGVFGFVAQNLGLQNAVIERAVFMSCTIPPAINPLLTLYFVGPYRRFITHFFIRKSRERETVNSSVGPNNRTLSNISPA